MKKSWWVILMMPLLLAGAGRAETLQQVLKAPHRQRVYDFAGVLSPAAEKKLRSRIHGMEQHHLAQGAVILVHRVEGASIENFATKVLNRWGVGERGKNNGFVLLAAIDQRKWRLATGTGLEKKIPNAEASQLMKSAVVPAFRKKQYAAGLDAALVQIQKRAASTSSKTASNATSPGAGTVQTGVPDMAPSPVSGSGSSGFPGWLIALIAVPVLIVASLFGNRGGGWNRGWNGAGNSGYWGNNWMNSSNRSSSSSSSSSTSSSSSSSSSPSSSNSSSSGDYGGGSSSGGGASGGW